MAKWRYIFSDLLTDTDVAEIDIPNPSFDSRIIVPGAFSTTIAVNNRSVADQVNKVIPDPDGVPQTICHVMRGGDIWDSYIIWTANPNIDETGNIAVALQGATIESWLDHRLCQDASFAAADQIDIARSLLTDAQIGDLSSPWATISANLGITTSPAGESGVIVDRAYLTTEAAMVGQRLQELANSDDGFEYRIRSYVSPDTGKRVREWNWGYPSVGGVGTHVFESPGSIMSFGYPIDVTAGGTAFWTRGDSVDDDVTADSQPLMAGPVTSDDLFNRGWVWLDHVQDFSGVSDLSTLQGYATWLQTVRRGGVRIATATVRLGDKPTSEILRPSQLGDTAQVVVKNDLWPLLQASWRVVGIGMKPAQRSAGQDVATLVFADVPDKPGA